MDPHPEQDTTIILSFEAGHITMLVHYAMAHWRSATTYAWPAPLPKPSGALLPLGGTLPLLMWHNMQTSTLPSLDPQRSQPSFQWSS